MTIKIQSLINQIEVANIIQDYRHGEIKPIDSDHVAKWISQFPEYSQDIILEETLHIIKNRYLSKQAIVEIYRKALYEPLVFGSDPKQTILESQFINDQLYGSSQSDLLKLLSAVVSTELHIPLNTEYKKTTKNYFYIDECIYSGNRVVQDIREFVNFYGLKNVNIKVLVLGSHTDGTDYIYRALESKLKSKGISFNVFSEYWFGNSFGKSFGVFRSRVDDKCSEQVSRYASDLMNHFYRHDVNTFLNSMTDFEEGLFKKRENRDIVEREFIEVGVSLLGSFNPSEHVKPLGFSKFGNLGFGGCFITYRNIANNCPIAFWFDKEEIYTKTYTSKDWIPLFPRKFSHKNTLKRSLLDQAINYERI